MDEKKEMVKEFSFLPFTGPVNLNHPALSMWVVFHYVRMNHSEEKEGDNPANHHLERVYFGRLLGTGGMREVLEILISLYNSLRPLRSMI